MRAVLELAAAGKVHTVVGSQPEFLEGMRQMSSGSVKAGGNDAGLGRDRQPNQNRLVSQLGPPRWGSRRKPAASRIRDERPLWNPRRSTGRVPESPLMPGLFVQCRLVAPLVAPSADPPPRTNLAPTCY